MTMLKFRKNIKFFFWIVAASFILWIFIRLGANIVGHRVRKPWERGIIAEINGQEIPYSVFNQRYSQAVQDTMKARGGRNLTPDEENAIEDDVWKKMLEDIAWDKVLRQRHLSLDDETVVELLRIAPPSEIRKMEFFKDSTTGQFDYRKYQQALADPRNVQFFIPFEMRYRREVPREIMRIDAYNAVSISDTEAWFDYKRRNGKVKLEYIAISIPDSLIKFTDDDLKKFYEENKDSFKLKNSANLAFVTIPKLPSRDDTLSAKEKLEVIMDQLNDLHIPFDSLAKEYSEDDLSRDKGGDLGWVFPSRNNPAFNKFFELYSALKDSEPGKVYGPILTNVGWHLAELVEKSGDSLHIKHILIRIVPSAQTIQNAHEKAVELQNLAREVGLDSAAAQMGLKVRETGEFQLDRDFIPYFGRDKELKEMLKKAKKGEVLPVIRRSRFYLVAQVKDRKKEYVPPFDEVKQRVELLYKRVMKRKLAEEYAQKIYKELQSGKSIEDVAKEFPQITIKHDTTNYFSMTQGVPGIPYMSEVYGFAFAGPVGKLSRPIVVGDVAYIVKVLDRKEPPKDNFVRFKSQMLKRQNMMTASKLWNAFTQEIIDSLHVKDYRNYILY